MSELRGLGVVHRELRLQKGQVVAVSLDRPEQARDVVERLELPFTLLSDADGSVVRQYGLLHEGGNPHGGDAAIPAMFLINREGVILWRHIAQRIQDRPNPRDLLDLIRRSASPAP